MNKFEKLIEYIINDEDDKARELFHNIVVEKSRDIYENIMAQEEVAGAPSESFGNEMEDMEAEETMHEEEDEEQPEGGDHDFGMDHDDDEGNPAGEVDGIDGNAEEQEIEQQVMNIDSKLDELLAKFDEIMGQSDHGMEEPMGMEEPTGEPEGHMEPMGMEEPMDEMFMEADEEEEEEEEEESKGNPFAKKDDKKDTKESVQYRKSSTELMREYTEKIKDLNLTGDAEGTSVGTGNKTGKVAVNKTPASVGPGNNFGGTANMAKGGVQNQDGTTPTKANNEYNKGQGEIKSGNVNVPGGKAGKPQSTGHEYTKDAKGAEGKTTDGTVPVAKKSVQVQNTGKK